MKSKSTIQYFTLLLLIGALFSGHYSLAQCGPGVGDVGGITDCGSGTFTEFSIISGTGGDGSAANPFIGTVEAKLCFQVNTYSEEALNYLHGVFLRNAPGGNFTNTGTGEQPTVSTPDADVTIPDGGTWRFFGTDDGIRETEYAQNTTAGDGVDGFIPFPGYYVTVDANDGDPRDNYGDKGDSDGIVIPSESFTGLEPFCFLVTLEPPLGGDPKTWTPIIGLSGDGNTGYHTLLNPTCVIADFMPPCGGGGDNDGTIHYQSDPSILPPNPTAGPACTNAVTPNGANTTNGDGIACNIDANSLACGSIEVTEFRVISSHPETGVDAANALVGDVEVRVCVDVKEFREVGLNYLHGIFIRNVPSGGNNGVSNFGSCGNPSGIQTINNPGTGSSDASHWGWFGSDDGIGQTDYPTNVAAADGDGFIPYAGFYATQGFADTNPRDNFGDAGNGVGIEGGTPETFELDEFCFYVTLSPAPGSPAASWTPNIGISGDGGTGSHTVPSTSCFVDANFEPACGGSDGLGAIHFKGLTSDALALNLTNFIATTNGQQNQIEWKTSNDQDVATYYVEKSVDGQVFQTIAEKSSLQKATPQQYQSADYTPAKLTYYRLKAMNTDGSIDYSKVIQVQREDAVTAFQVFPTIVKDQLTIQSAVTTIHPAKIVLTDLAGKVILNREQKLTTGQTLELDLTQETKGIYLLTIENASERFFQKIVKH